MRIKNYKITATTFIFLILTMASVASASTGNTWVKCLEGLSSYSKESYQSCHNTIKIDNLKTITSNSTIPLITHSYTLDLGLGEPVFGSLKRSRDNFIRKHITDNIAKIETHRDEMMRKFNLKSAYNNIIGPQPSMLSNLKSLFGLDGLAETFAQIKAARQQKCDEKFQNEYNSCQLLGTHQEKSNCLSEAYAIKSNCFKFTTNKPLFNNITQLLDKYENQLLEAVDSISLVNTDGFRSIRTSLESASAVVESKTDEFNKIFSVDIDGRLGGYLEGNLTDLLERKIGNLIGVDETLLGPGTYANKLPEDEYLLNFNQDFSGSVSTSGNLCNLTKCLMYPKSKRGSTDYKTTCVAAGLSEGDLNKTINNVRRQLTAYASTMVMRKLMIDIPVQAQLKKIRTALVCAQVATLNTVQGTIASGINSIPGLSVSGEASTTVVENAGSDTATECFKENSQQAKSGVNTSGGFGALHQAGDIKMWGPFTATFNVPYISRLMAQVGIEFDGALTAPIKNLQVLALCQAKGKSDAWLENYQNCEADYDTFTIHGPTVNASVKGLMFSQWKWAKAECDANLWPSTEPTVLTRKLEYAKTNPDITPDPLSPNSLRWDELTDAMISAKERLNKAKIKPFNFPTQNAICANNLFEVIRKQNNNIFANSSYSCAVIDESDAPLISVNSVVIDDINLASGSTIQPLVPSIMELCISSADIIKSDYRLDTTLDDQLPIGVTRYNIPTDHVFNPQNSIKITDEYALTRAISNIKYCDTFFSEIIGLKFPISISVPSLANQNLLMDELTKNQNQLTYAEMSVLDKATLDYNETLSMIKSLSEVEQFALCVKKSKYRELLYKKRSGIDQATLDFCRVYKTNRFDLYYYNAKKSLKFETTTQSGRDSIDREIIINDRRFRDGSI
jgi:hypothetical protein